MMVLSEGLVGHIVQSVVRNRRRELETIKRDVHAWKPLSLLFAHHLR